MTTHMRGAPGHSRCGEKHPDGLGSGPLCYYCGLASEPAEPLKYARENMAHVLGYLTSETIRHLAAMLEALEAPCAGDADERGRAVFLEESRKALAARGAR